MPDRSDRVEAAYDAAEEGELPYISKSRVMTWIKNPEHFRLKYVEELKASETDAMVRGTRIHEAFEGFYEAEQAYGPSIMSDPALYLPDDRQLWADFTVPYIANFLAWEQRRLNEADATGSDWAPTAIEAEHWVDPILGVDHEPEWMGLADVILPAGSVPEIEADDGVVVVDFKTGSVPDTRYRDDGIHTELEYYVMLFEDEYDVQGAAAYYPREDELVVQPDDEYYRANIEAAVADMVEHVAEDYDHFPTNPGPLCKWGEGDDEQSEYYGICPCSWGVPANNRERFEKLANRNLSDEQVAHKMDTTADAVRYWKSKFDLW